jgi:hypothetical protein
MKPEVGQILGLSAQRLAQGVGADGAAFAQGTIGLIGVVLSMSANEYDRGADIRVAENADLRALFGELGGTVRAAGLRKKLEDAARSKESSLRISALNEANYTLRRLLTELQIDAEDRHDHAAQTRIWSVLRAMADRRVVPLG